MSKTDNIKKRWKRNHVLTAFGPIKRENEGMFRKGCHRRPGILLKTALLAWLVAVFTVGMFLAVILPNQKQTFLENLESKAHGVSVSLQDIAAGAVVTENYGEVVAHCMEILGGDQTIEFLVLTRNDGFSLVHTRDEWRNENLPDKWYPERRNASSELVTLKLAADEVLKYSMPFDYSGIEWGWIHIGLSLDSYRANIAASRRSTAWMALFCLLVGLIASVFYAKHIVNPIILLRTAAQSVAEGDLNVRAQVHSGDEVEELAHAFNSMAASIQDREDRVFHQNKRLSQLVIDETLHAGDLLQSARLVSRASAETLDIQRVGVWLMTEDRCSMECLDLFDLKSNEHAQEDVFLRAGNEPYFDALKKTRTLSAEDVTTDKRLSSLTGTYLRPRNVVSILDATVRVRGTMVGVVCHEHVGLPRHWTLEEENFAGSVADLIALAIEARDRVLVQNELLIAKEAAEAASEAKSQFLANMSHELRTPINGVMGMLQLLQNEELNHRQSKHVATALNSAQSLLSVIGDVLDFSKIEAGRLELDNTEFVLRDDIDRAAQMLAGQAQSKGLELVCTVENDVPRKVIGDPAHLRQILINLVGNAVKFTGQGEIQVGCRRAKESGASTVLEFYVSDTGPGIPQEQLDNIFKSFSQGDPSMHREYGGTGLGLAISCYLVGLMGGEIGVKSVFGEGSTFTFTVQVDACEDSLPHEQLCTIQSQRVLVVDDNRTARTAVSNYLLSWGCAVEQATSGPDAMKHIAANELPYSVILIDAEMPGMSGMQLSKMIGETCVPHPPARLLLSTINLPSETQLKQVGIDGVIMKPVRASNLYDEMLRALSGDIKKALPKAIATEAETTITVMDGSVLIVEDNEINQEVAREMILHKGYSCDCLSSGKHAIEAIATDRYKLVFMDCQMPEIDGYETTKLIREWEQQNRPGRSIPIVALTAHAMSGDRERCLEAGMDDYMGKPLKFHELDSMLKKWIKKKQPDSVSDTVIAESASLEQGVVKRCSGNQFLAVKLLRAFMVQTEEDLAAIKAAVAAEDSENLSRAAHRLKGAAGNLGLTAIATAAKSLEESGRNGQTKGVDSFIKKLHNEADIVLALPMLKENAPTDLADCESN